MSVMLTHWGAFLPQIKDGKLVGADPLPGDPDPSRIIQSIPGTQADPVRIGQPMVRAGYLEKAPPRGKGAAASPLFPSPGNGPPGSSPTRSGASPVHTATPRSSADPMGGQAQDVSITPRARCIGS